MATIEITAMSRSLQGTGASRRLRGTGKVPGIIYGGEEPAKNVEFDHNGLFHQLKQEAFHASILSMNVDGKKQPLPGTECRPLEGSRHHLCEAPLPALSPGKHTLRVGAVRTVDGKEKASELSDPLTVMRDLTKGS